MSGGFCIDCPDHEACATGWPCDLVQRIDATHTEEERDG